MTDRTEITYQGFTPTEANKAFVEEMVGKFEKNFDRISSCRVAISAPGHRHRNDGQYRVSIRLRLPTGKEIDVSRTPTADERHQDFHFAVSDAFKRAKRQLQDKVRLLRQDVKSHEGAPEGVVVQLRDDHGFIASDAGEEVYFHRNSVLGDGFGKLDIGTRVIFAQDVGDKGPQASTVRIPGGHKGAD
jgi:cold shock CspA family protein/ribosome-associated translation inhibitor RaiA